MDLDQRLIKYWENENGFLLFFIFHFKYYNFTKQNDLLYDKQNEIALILDKCQEYLI